MHLAMLAQQVSILTATQGEYLTEIFHWSGGMWEYWNSADQQGGCNESLLRHYL